MLVHCIEWMPAMDLPPAPLRVISRLVDATNAHDLDALAGCFASDYRNETPAHPARGFTGREQVRRNWQQIFAAVPDVEATVVSTAVDGDAVWSEWAMAGTRADGSTHRMAGVMIFGVRGAEIASARFYLEPLDEDGGGVDDAVRQVTRA
jgi:ketosteroid isomerase-like protein